MCSYINGSKLLVVNPASRSEVENLAASLCHMDEIRQHCLLSNDELCHAIFGALSEIASVALLKVFRHNVSLIKNPSKVMLGTSSRNSKKETYENDSIVRINPFEVRGRYSR